MTTLIAPPDAPDAAVDSASGCTLRVRRRGEAERTYSLASGKCTIGSSPRCHICLPAADARPLQCLVALETSAAVVTRWAAGVLLNGREFATAPLGAGDKLSIGPWEIDVQSISPPTLPEPPAARETQDFTPPPAAEPEAELPVEVAPAVEPVQAAWAPTPELTQPSADASPAPQQTSFPRFAPPARTARASAKTIHMGDEAVPLLLAAPRRPDYSTSQAFADRLLVKLWTANHLARNRCRALLAVLRDALRVAEESAANCAAAESQLAQAASTQETQATHWKATRVTLEGELSALQTELAACNAARDRLAAELAALTNEQAQDAADREHNESLFEAHAALEQELTKLRRQLTERDEQLTERDDRLQTLTAERASAVEALHVLDHQLRLEQDRYEALVGQAQLRPSDSELAPPAPSLPREPAFSPLEVEPARPLPQVPGRHDEPLDSWPSVEPANVIAEAPSPWTLFSPPADDEHAAAQSPTITDDAPQPAHAFDDQAEDGSSTTPSVAQHVPTLPVAAEEPRPDFVPVSFIDRYRNLLDDAADGAGFEASSRRSLLDDEYLSPAQAEAHDDPVEDSDEALEAYMSNLMRRVRGDSPTPGPTLAAQSRSKPLTSGLLASAPDSFAAPPEPEAPAEPFDLEIIKRTPRRPLNLDLAALREIANVTARTAIAEHRQRRHVESIITKVIISAMGVAAGAYALLAAPSFDSPWFWAGCLAATTSAGLAVQLSVVLRRRINRRRRHLDPQAANEYHSEPLHDPNSDFTAEDAENAERTSKD